MDTMTIENVYGQDVVNQGALYLTLLAKAVINIDGGRRRNEEDDLLIAEAMAWGESFSNFIDDEEIKVSELSDQQKYLHSQLLDLRNKEASLKFQLDQVAASMSVFQNAFVEASKEVAEEVLDEEEETKEVN